jgi:hypothetical protein
MSAIVSVDDGKHHISISLPQRQPTWDELLAVWRWYAGDDVEGVIVVPRKADHVNLAENCLHVWESACGREGCG